MIKLTKAAAEQVRFSADQTNSDHLSLRVAVREDAEGNFHYGIGFDEPRDDDLAYDSEGIEIVFAPEFGPKLDGAVIDFVEIEGEQRLIVMNPRDPNYKPPQTGPDDATIG